MNSYELSRNFWDWCFENPEKIKPIHPSIYFFAIEHCNRLGWKEKFGLPSQMVMEAIGVKNWKTYSAGLNDLVEFGFLNLIEKSKNQYSSNIIAIVNFTKAPTKALDKALDKALSEHTAKHSLKRGQSIVSIDKQLNNKTIKQKNNKGVPPSFNEFLKHAKEKAKERNIELDENKVQTKYDAWLENEWCDLNGKKIINWKVKITSNITYWQKINKVTSYSNSNSRTEHVHVVTKLKDTDFVDPNNL